MIREQEGESPTRADGESRGTGEVIFADDTILHFIVIADVEGRRPIDGGLDLLAIAIIVKIPVAAPVTETNLFSAS